jgi:hypothetical protein
MIRLDRFSPNFDDASRLGFVDVTPLPPYRYVYALPGQALANLAYFFTFSYRQPRDVKRYVTPLSKQVRRWRRRWPACDLFSVDTGDCLLVWDLRPRARALVTALRGADRVLYQACDSASDLRRLDECLQQHVNGPPTPPPLEDRLQRLVESGLVVREGLRYLALAVPLGEYSPPPAAIDRFYDLVEARGSRVRKGWTVPADTLGPASRSRGSVRGRPAHGPPRDRAAGRLTASQFSINRAGQVLVRRIRAL